MGVEFEIGELLRKESASLAVAESCTGGSIAALITSVPGSSTYFRGGIIAYSDEIKRLLLGVSGQTLDVYGAVSRETVVEMVCGVRRKLRTDAAIAVSGIAGPGGGTKEKPLGLVWIAVTYKGKTVVCKQEGDEGRRANIERSVQTALTVLRDLIVSLKSGKGDSGGEIIFDEKLACYR